MLWHGGGSLVNPVGVTGGRSCRHWMHLVGLSTIVVAACIAVGVVRRRTLPPSGFVVHRVGGTVACPDHVEFLCPNMCVVTTYPSGGSDFGPAGVVVADADAEWVANKRGDWQTGMSRRIRAYLGLRRRRWIVTLLVTRPQRSAGAPSVSITRWPAHVREDLALTMPSPDGLRSYNLRYTVRGGDEVGVAPSLPRMQRELSRWFKVTR